MQRLVIDLSQHHRLMGINGDIRRSTDLPSVLMPMRLRDQGVAGAPTAGHVRGLGLPWPPEAQVPVAGDPTRGVGRIPLAACWGRIQSSRDDQTGASEASEPSPLDVPNIEDFCWQPIPGTEIALSPGQALGLAVDACRRETGPTQGPTVLVGPCSLDEGMQQYVLDACGSNTHVLPRSIAVVLDWLANDAAASNLHQSPKLGEIGHVVTVFCGLDGWEVDVVPIEARDLPEGRVLLPVRLTPSSGISIGVNGLQLALGRRLTATQGVLINAWRDVITNPESFITDEQLGSNDLITQAPQVAGASLINALLGDAVSNSECIASRVQRLYQNRIKEAGITSPLRAILSSGSWASTLCHGESIAACMASELVRYADLSVLAEDSATRGADVFLEKYVQGKVAYLEELIPVSIHYQILTNGRVTNAWKSLVGEEKALRLEAGREFIGDPILEFSVEAGKNELDITLRRPNNFSSLAYAYRGVTINFPVAADQREPVVITTRIRPGQGFAQVCVDGQDNKGIAAFLNWRELTRVDDPSTRVTTIGYPPMNGRITPSKKMWKDALPAISALEKGVTKGKISALRDHLRKWPSFIEIHGSDNVSDEDIFAHYSLFPINDHTLPDYAVEGKKRIIKALTPVWSKFNREAIRLFAWFNDAAPHETVNFAKECLGDYGQPVDLLNLHVATLSFKHKEEFRVFWSRITHEISQHGPESLYPDALDWLRPIRNLCMFRDVSLSTDVISDEDMLTVAMFTCNCLSDSIDKKRQSLFNFSGPKCAQQKASVRNQAIRTLPFILRRRIYDPSFADEESTLYRAIERSILHAQRDNLGSLAQLLNRYLAATQRFLNRTATMDDVRSLVK